MDDDVSRDSEQRVDIETLPYFLTDRFANIAFWVVCVVWLLPEFIGAFTQNAEPSAQKRDRGSLMILYLAIFIGMSLAFSSSYVARNLAMPEPRGLIFWVGIALMLLGVALRWYAIRVLGKFFSRDVAVRAGQTVIEAGPYRYIRHPSYTGMLLTFLGLGLALGNWASLAAVMGCVSAGYVYRVRVEERALADELGQPYRDYMQRTRRFIPFLI